MLSRFNEFFGKKPDEDLKFFGKPSLSGINTTNRFGLYFFAANFNGNIKSKEEAAKIVKTTGKGLFRYSSIPGLFTMTFKVPSGIAHVRMQARDKKGNILMNLDEVKAKTDNDLFFINEQNLVEDKETLKKSINGEFAGGGKRKSRKSRRHRKNRTRRH